MLIEKDWELIPDFGDRAATPLISSLNVRFVGIEIADRAGVRQRRGKLRQPGRRGDLLGKQRIVAIVLMEPVELALEPVETALTKIEETEHIERIGAAQQATGVEHGAAVEHTG